MSYGLQSLSKFNNRREHEVIFTSLEGYFVSSVKVSFIRTSFAGRKELGKSSGLKTEKVNYAAYLLSHLYDGILLK